MGRSKTFRVMILAGLLASIWVSHVNAMWTNRYPKLDDFRHQVYLEQHDLPALANGPTDPAPSPDGKSVVIAAQGWLWSVDLETGIATRITDKAAIDSRPRFSPDGKQLAFVRDYGEDTVVIVLNLDSGDETIIDTAAIDLDPEFSADGAYIFYSSGVSGSLSVWSYHLASGAAVFLPLPRLEGVTIAR